MWSYNYTDPDILEHYGILGMKWGVRRFQDKKGRLTSAGKKRYSEESSNGSSKNSSKNSKEVGDSFIERKLGVKFSDRTKTAIKVGAGIAAAALVAYGGYRLYNSDAGKPLRDYIDGLIGKRLESEDRFEFKRTGIHTMQSGDSYRVSLIILEWIISKLTTIPFTMLLALLVFRESIQTLWRPIPSQLIIIEKRFWNLNEIIRKILAMIYHCRMFEKQCIGITVLKFRRISCLT